MFVRLLERNGAVEPQPNQSIFTNYSGLADHFAKGFPVSGNIILRYSGWKGFKSKTKEFKALERALLAASHVVSLELKDVWPSTLSRLESDLFSDFLKENMSLRIFKCESKLLTPSMMEALMSSQTVDEIYIGNKNSHEYSDIDEALTIFAKKSHASFMSIENGIFTLNSPVSGILRAVNLTTLHLLNCRMSESERKGFCKLLAAHDNLKSFDSDIEFGVKDLIPYWYGESNPRPNLSWSRVKIRGSFKIVVFLKRFIRERTSVVNFVHNDLVFKHEILLRTHFATLERLVQPERFNWPNDYPGMYVGNNFRVGSLNFMSKIFPEAKALTLYMQAHDLELRMINTDIFGSLNRAELVSLQGYNMY